MNKLFLALLFCLYSQLLMAYSSIIDGAEANVHITVVDDCNLLVTNATISVVFYIEPEKVNVKRGETNERGEFIAKGNCIGEAYVWIRKEGYYETKSRLCIKTLKDADVEKLRKWSENPVSSKFVLKRKRHPIKMTRFDSIFSPLTYPATNVVMGFDFVAHDWCKPYGKGKIDDLQVKYNFWRSTNVWLKVFSSIDISMTNCVDGFYYEGCEKTSQMKYQYEADTNRVYQKSLHYEYDRRTGTVKNRINMPKDHYIVFRYRTRVNDEGEITSARYGFSIDKFEYGIWFDFRYLLNPNENDTNLEEVEIVP